MVLWLCYSLLGTVWPFLLALSAKDAKKARTATLTLFVGMLLFCCFAATDYTERIPQMTTSSKFSYRQVFPAIPQELKVLSQWVVWRLEPRGGKPTKVPYNAYTAQRAESNNPTTWATFERALETFTRSAGYYNGLGFMFNRDYVGVDLDHCIADGVIDEWAQKRIDALATYAERSQSKTGVHAIARALLPEHIDKQGVVTHPGTRHKVPNAHQDAAIEMYCEGRFFVMTGNHVEGTPASIEDRQEQITALYRELKPAKGKVSSSKTTPQRPLVLADNLIIEKAMKAQNGAAFTALWQGDTSAYLSHSEADLALCNILAFWTGKDSVAMDRLFRRSQLYRDKWDRDDYRQSTINKAIEECGNVYTGWETLNTSTATSSYSNGNGNGNGHHNSQEEKSRSFNLTDLGNAERFEARYKATVRWCETWNTWLVFNGKCWEHDQEGRVDQLAKATVRAIYHEAANETDDAKRAQLVKHAKSSESSRAIRALLDRAKSELPAIPEEFNQHLYLLNFQNGTLDLRSGELRPHRPEDRLTRCLKINYNPRATCTKFKAFIASIFAGNAALIDFVKQAIGMSLCGDISEQCWFLCHGTGSNGKTTLLEIVRILLGEYALAANIETFQVRKGEHINNDVAELYGARFVTSEENQQGSRLNEAFVKKLTGNQPLRARRLHENEFQFMPECTLWLAVNHKPVVKDTSKGMWRRVHFIPFNVTFDGQQINKHLGRELLAEEAEGILAFLVAGCRDWIQQGRLIPPSEVLQATASYRAEMDVIGRYLDARCEKDAKEEIGATALYNDYKHWCDATGERWEKQKTFGDWLSEQGYSKEKKRIGKTVGIVYKGLRLLPPENENVDDVDDVDDSSDSPITENETSQKSRIEGLHRLHRLQSEEPTQQEAEILERVKGHTVKARCNPDGCCPRCHCRLETYALTRWECMSCYPPATYSDATMQLVKALAGKKVSA